MSAPPVAFDLWHVAVPLLHPFEAAHGTETHREVVVLRAVDADGGEGWGECDALTHPTYTHEYAAGAFAVLRDELLPATLGGGAPPPHAGLHPMARAAVVTALADLALRRSGRSLAAALAAGATPSGALARTAVLGRHPDLDRLVAAVDTALAGGAALVKLKVAGAADLAVLARLRAERPAAALAADANGSLAGRGPAELVAAGLDRLGLAYLEQPYPADALLELAELRRVSTTPVALDESITSLAAARVAHALGALDALNVKPARLGGPHEAAAVARWAADAGLAVFCGGMVELGIGRAAAAAVAALGACTLPTDLGPSAAYVAAGDELCTPLGTDPDGRLVVPLGAGLGVTVDPARVARAARRHARVVRR